MIGKDWYQQVNASLGGDVRLLATFAVLSPQLTVRQNYQSILELLYNKTTRIGFPTNVLKATTILSTGDLSLVKGPKVSEFFRSLTLVKGAICVDRHMLAWGGCAASWSQRNVEHVKAQVREYARAHRLETFEAQSVIWHQLAALDSRLSPLDIFQDVERKVRG